jgi:hypothetical protein
VSAIWLIFAVADPTQHQTEPWKLLTSLQLHRQKEQLTPVLFAPSQRKTLPLEWYHFQLLSGLAAYRSFQRLFETRRKLP